MRFINTISNKHEQYVMFKIGQNGSYFINEIKLSNQFWYFFVQMIPELLTRFPEVWNCHYKNSSMPALKLENLPGLDILKYFQNEDYSVKVFQMIYKYLVVSQQYLLTPEQIQNEKVSIDDLYWAIDRQQLVGYIVILITYHKTTLDSLIWHHKKQHNNL